MKSIRNIFVLTTILLITLSNSLKIAEQAVYNKYSMKNNGYKVYSQKTFGRKAASLKGSFSYRQEKTTNTTAVVAPAQATAPAQAQAPEQATATATNTTGVPGTPEYHPSMFMQIIPNYNDLVNSGARPKCKNLYNPALENRHVLENIENFPTAGPHARANPFKLMDENDTSHINYLFDYLQDMIIKKQGDKKLMTLITEELQTAFEEAKAMPKKVSIYSNPYTAPKLLFYFSKGIAGEQPFTDNRLINMRAVNSANLHAGALMVPPIAAASPNITPDDKVAPDAVFESIKNYNKNFDRTIWENGITPIQLGEVLRDWNWGSGGDSNDIMAIKKIFDTYDFDGDGSLNRQEFGILQIISVVRAGRMCRKNCLDKSIQTVTEPLFMYLDCDSDGFINADNMWEGLKNILRGDMKDKYNMYQCQLPVELNKWYRTNSCGEFILKATQAADGFVNKNEFTQGILTGFWQRQVAKDAYYVNGTQDMVNAMNSLRWTNQNFDIVCENIIKFMPKQ